MALSPSGIPSRGAIQAEIEAAVAALAAKTQTGSGSVSVTASAETTGVVNFTTPFAAAPNAVVATSTNDLYYVVQTVSYTATGFTVRVRHKLGSSASATVGVRFIAST